MADDAKNVSVGKKLLSNHLKHAESLNKVGVRLCLVSCLDLALTDQGRAGDVAPEGTGDG